MHESSRPDAIFGLKLYWTWTKVFYHAHVTVVRCVSSDLYYCAFHPQCEIAVPCQNPPFAK